MQPDAGNNCTEGELNKTNGELEKQITEITVYDQQSRDGVKRHISTQAASVKAIGTLEKATEEGYGAVYDQQSSEQAGTERKCEAIQVVMEAQPDTGNNCTEGELNKTNGELEKQITDLTVYDQQSSDEIKRDISTQAISVTAIGTLEKATRE